MGSAGESGCGRLALYKKTSGRFYTMDRLISVKLMLLMFFLVEVIACVLWTASVSGVPERACDILLQFAGVCGHRTAGVKPNVSIFANARFLPAPSNL